MNAKAIIHDTIIGREEITNFYKKLGNKLKRLRKFYSLNQKDFAVELGVGRQPFISNRETGRTKISLDEIYRIHRKFNVPLTYFFDDNEELSKWKLLKKNY